MLQGAEVAEERREEDEVHQEDVEDHQVVADRGADSVVAVEGASEVAVALAEVVHEAHHEAEAGDTRTLYMKHWRRRLGVQLVQEPRSCYCDVAPPRQGSKAHWVNGTNEVHLLHHHVRPKSQDCSMFSRFHSFRGK